MKSKGKLKESLKEKANFKFLYVIIFAGLALVIASGIFIWVAPRSLTEKIIPSPSPSPVPTPQVFSDIKNPEEASEVLASIEATDKEWSKIREDSEMNGIYFIPSEERTYAVYDLDQENILQEAFTFAHFNHIWVDSPTDSFYTVINISGEKVDLSGYYILVRNDGSDYAGRVIYNCYEAKEVILKDTILTGTLLAPKAKITFDKTYLYGQYYGASSEGYLRYCKDISFTGYAEFVKHMVPVVFETRAVKEAALSALAIADPMSYNMYTYDDNLYLCDLEKITSLDLSCTAIPTFKNDLKYFTGISALSLRDSSVLNVDFTQFTNLVSLDISGSLVNFTDLSQVPDLRSLSISGLDINKFDLSKVPGLVYLEACNCGITDETFKQIKKLTGLTTLLVGGNPGITKLDLSSFENMTQLNFGGTTLTEFDIRPYKNSLTYLSCSNCGVKDLDLTEFVALKYLEAEGFETINITLTPSLNLKSIYVDKTATVIGLEDK